MARAEGLRLLQHELRITGSVIGAELQAARASPRRSASGHAGMRTMRHLVLVLVMRNVYHAAAGGAVADVAEGTSGVVTGGNCSEAS